VNNLKIDADWIKVPQNVANLCINPSIEIIWTDPKKAEEVKQHILSQEKLIDEYKECKQHWYDEYTKLVKEIKLQISVLSDSDTADYLKKKALKNVLKEVGIK